VFCGLFLDVCQVVQAGCEEGDVGLRTLEVY